MKDILTKFAADATKVGQEIKPVPDGSGAAVTDTLQSDVTKIINVVIGVLGIIAVVVIILGGVQYMTSSGDASKVKKAKDTILYGVIGLIVVALAFAIVNFVIMNVLGNR